MKANKLRPLVLAVAATWGVSAQAGITWYSPITTFEDDDIDWFLDRAAPEGDNDIGVLNTTPSRTGTLDVGDVTVAVFEITRSFGEGGEADVTGGELTGIVASQVVAKSDEPDLLGNYSYLFGPVTEGLNSILSLANIAGVTGGAAGEGAIAAMYFGDEGTDLELVDFNCTSMTNCMEYAADNGSLWQVDGFSEEAEGDQFWFATGGDSIGTIADSDLLNLASITFGGDVIVNGTGKELGLINCAPFCQDTGFLPVVGGGSIHGGADVASIGAYARSDFDFKKAPIPEPGTLALLAAGLLGVGLRRRKQSTR